MSRRIDVSVAGGRLAFGSVGAGYSSLITVSGRGAIVMITSSLNQEVVISLNGGTTDWGYLPLVPATAAGFPYTIELGANDAEFTGTISVKHNGVAPTAGAIAASVIRLL